MTTAGGASVSFESVSKRFFRGRRIASLGDWLSGGRSRREPFWALRDISFAVQPGDALGIIGPNGSGKSTVLRLLAGILRADEGRVNVSGPNGRRGRLGGVIELSAGFHYELTGRENVYLQGAVLGMRRAEIARRFDEIVEFAELEFFIDTPVKHYSSGMIARLGFSVAAHLDPDILIIDEVLAVGDDAFQKKAFARMAAMVRSEVPAIVVSHQLHRITELCNRAILLTRGSVLAAGSPSECVEVYVAATDSAPAPGVTPVKLASLSVCEPAVVDPGQRVRLLVQGTVAEPDGASRVSVGVRVRSLPTEELVFVAVNQ
ncbi:MAG: ABC transporter ATP-binding protein, partial [Gemmatimonadaceae bacterium]